MPFLFVDYNQGAGGEKFCAELSKSKGCNLLESFYYNNGRTKVLDVFQQEFLKPRPKITRTIDPGPNYTIVPCHRQTKLAKELLGPIKSIRIKAPEEEKLHQWVKDQQIKKVLLSREPTQDYFLGLVKILKETCKDPDFVRRVKYNMLNVEIILLSQGIDPTQEAIDYFIEQVRSRKEPEPDFEYDLVIPYENLVGDPGWVKQQIKNKFDISVVGNWLESYGQNYS